MPESEVVVRPVSKGRKAVVGVARMALAAAVLAWIYRSGVFSRTVFAGLLVNWVFTAIAVTLFIGSGVLSAWRLCILLRAKGHYLSLSNSVRLTFIGLFFNLCLPGGAGGDVTRVYYASIGNSGWRTELTTIVLLDRATGLLALFLWPVIAALFFGDLLSEAAVIRNLIWLAAIVSLAMMGGMFLLLKMGFPRKWRFAWLVRRLPRGRNLADVWPTLLSYRDHMPALVGAALVSMVIHTMSVAVVLLAQLAIAPGDFSWRVALLAPLGFLANALPITPGGLGVGEAAFASLYRMSGLSGGPPVMLAWRGVSLVGSLVGLFFYLQGKRRMVYASAAVAYESGS